MNHYGLKAREYWARVNPTSFAQFEDPTTFFTELGEQMLTEVNNLVPALMGSAPAGESTMGRIGRESAAKKQAEEISWDNLVFVQPETTLEEAREEWASTQLPLSSLTDWAVRAQEPETKDFEPSADTVAEEWQLPESFLSEMLASENPYLFVGSDWAKMVLAKAEDDRYRLWQQHQLEE